MKLTFTAEETKEIKKIIENGFSESGVLVKNGKVSFVIKKNFYDNVNYDVDRDEVYNFINVRDEIISETDDFDNTVIYYATTSDETSVRNLFTSNIIKIVNAPYDERMYVRDIVITGDSEAVVSEVKINYKPKPGYFEEIDESRAIDIDNTELKEFISKVNFVHPQNMMILNNNSEAMAFISISGMMMFKKLGKILPEDFANIILTTEMAEKIKYVSFFENYFLFYDENKRLIKINNFVNCDGYKVVFDRMEIVGKKVSVPRNDFVKALKDIEFVSSNDKSEFKLKFLKTKIKFSILKDFIVDNCTIEFPSKNADVSAKTFTLSAKIIKDYVSKINSEKIEIGTHNNAFRINSDDINFIFAELTNRSED